MPRAAIEHGYATRVIPLEAIANTLIAHCGIVRALPVKEQYPVRSTGPM